MKRIIKWISKPFYVKYQDLLFRLSNLEIAVDYLIKSPTYISADNIGFNGQQYRKQIFLDLLSEFKFDLIIETGTWVGNTTGYMAEKSNLPIYTVELNERFHSIAKNRLSGFKNITFKRSDSRTFLKSFSSSGPNNQRVFIYLDAHWYDDLPLEEELMIITDTWNDFVIMIDDFQVPGDDGYGYDDYGKNKSLTFKTFSHVFARHGLTAFFPAASSSKESGGKRGCVVLARDGESSQRLSKIQSLSMKG